MLGHTGERKLTYVSTWVVIDNSLPPFVSNRLTWGEIRYAKHCGVRKGQKKLTFLMPTNSHHWNAKLHVNSVCSNVAANFLVQHKIDMRVSKETMYMSKKELTCFLC